MSLNDQMDFDHVIRVDEQGNVSDAEGINAPDLFDGELVGNDWTLLAGYSGQDRYSGPIMHNSEFIGGQMERDILARPGLYVSLVCYWDNSDDEAPDAENPYVEGWAVAFREVEQ